MVTEPERPIAFGQITSALDIAPRVSKLNRASASV
jgi:hypothetical protein